jgi:hypothetical protein
MKIFQYRFSPILAIVWLLALWLLQRDVSSRSFLTKDALIDINDGALLMRQDYLGFYLGGEKIGYSRFVLKEDNEESLSKLPGKFYIFTSDTHLTIQAMGMAIDVKIQQLGEVNEDLSIRSFQFNFEASGQKLYVLGLVDEEGLHVTTRSEGATTQKTVETPAKIYNPDIVHLLLAREGLIVGKSYFYPVYDPLNMALGNIVAKVETREDITLSDGKTVEAYKIDLDFKGFHTTSWINKDGDVFKEISQIAGITFTAMRETQEQAIDLSFSSDGVEQDRHDGTRDLIDASKITPDNPIHNPKDVIDLRVKLIGAAIDDVVIDNTYQFLEKEEQEELILRIKKLNYQAISASLPVETPPYPPDEQLHEFLEDDALVQASNPRIREKAMEITQNAKNRWEASETIAMWLYKNIRKEMRVTIPSALEVLNSMKGDCNEHSALFAALTRAIGIPAKIIAGLVYMDDGFYYHAWNEVYLGDQWVPIDSTLDRIEMDAAHIKLAEGALDSQANIVKLIGNLKVEVLSFK